MQGYIVNKSIEHWKSDYPDFYGNHSGVIKVSKKPVFLDSFGVGKHRYKILNSFFVAKSIHSPKSTKIYNFESNGYKAVVKYA